jgi:hypothetical protein
MPLAEDLESQEIQMRKIYGDIYEWYEKLIDFLSAKYLMEEVLVDISEFRFCPFLSVIHLFEDIAQYGISRVPLVKKMVACGTTFLTVLLTGLLTKAADAADAMGYSGVDGSSSFAKSINYFPVNQKELLASHCAMRIPTKELMEKIYVEALMKRKNYGFRYFGCYKESG